MKDIIAYRNSLRASNEFNPKEIVERYKEFAARNDTFRFLRPKPGQIKTFGLRSRTGVHDVADTNRKEEMLCKALFNTYKPEGNDESKPWYIPNYTQYIVDYQTPLKGNATDEYWGKIDLIGLIQGSPKKHVCFWEVKFGQNKDTIHYALMELLVYYAQFDLTTQNEDNAMKNYTYLLLEAAFVRGTGDANNTVTIHQDKRPILIIAADEKYYSYHEWQAKKPAYAELKRVVNEELNLTLEFLQIGTSCCIKNNRYYYSDNQHPVLL